MCHRALFVHKILVEVVRLGVFSDIWLMLVANDLVAEFLLEKLTLCSTI